MCARQLQMYGGSWTEKKLQILSKYLEAYTKALKNQPFELIYIDAFAGTGYRELPTAGPDDEGTLFAELVEPDPQQFLDGSARMALGISPPFHRYMFIEKSGTRLSELKKLRDSSDLCDRIELKLGDCNDELLDICMNWDWRGQRAVLFLDPFGMQVDWSTIEAVARTRAIDMWILFPISAVNRLLTQSGNIPTKWADRLTNLFGTPTWQEEFYQNAPDGLFGSTGVSRKACDWMDIAGLWNERLRSVFADVADNPRMLHNSTGAPLFLFCFAAANPKGAPIAKRIAGHILEHME
ncbi:MAG TPA: three-Cys-motif partner protein TcmP [Phycisphaerae bacterium]|nr:three-Cys-motif partner protein TcmP [Phycisphaerae bacterium]HDZ44876.1 three-Cys-motif partner protein TcmP [Phycisphaerae bacterium]